VIKQVIIAGHKKGSKMKKKTVLTIHIFLFALISIFCVQSYVAEKGHAMLDTKGNVVLQIEINNQKIKKRKEEEFHRFVLPMKLSLTNNQEKPLLILKKAVQIVGVRMATTESNLKKGVFIYDSLLLPSFIQKDLLNLQSPSQDITETVSSGGRYVWYEDYWLSLNEKQSYNSTSPSISLEKLNTLDYLWIEFDLAFFPMNSMSDEGNKLKAIWKHEGNLLLDTLATKPIKISIPQKIDSCTNES
jgi:hypothetical protein